MSDSVPPAPRVLIVLLGAIGDVVRGLPLAHRIKSGWPESHITWAVEPASAPIVRHHPWVDDVVLFERKKGVSAYLRFLREVRAVKADIAIDLQRHLKSGLVTGASGASRRVGFHWQNSREGNWFFSNEHITPVERFSPKIQHYLLFADYLGLPKTPIEFGLKLRDEESARVDAMLAAVRRPLAVLFVGASGPSKRWFPDRLAAVARGLDERGYGVVLVGGPEEKSIADAVVAAGAPKTLNLAGRTTLRDVIGLAERATLAISGDSGPMHIAAAVGTPVIGLFGATDPARSSPFGFDELVLRGTAPCAPCYRKTCPIGQVCMQAISVEAVLAQVDRVPSLRTAPSGSTH